MGVRRGLLCLKCVVLVQTDRYGFTSFYLPISRRKELKLPSQEGKVLKERYPCPLIHILTREEEWLIFRDETEK